MIHVQLSGNIINNGIRISTPQMKKLIVIFQNACKEKKKVENFGKAYGRKYKHAKI